MTLRQMALKAADRLGVYQLLGRRRHGAIALAYHGVEEKILNARIQGVHMPLGLFEQHIDYIARNFEVLSLDDLADRLEQGRGLDGRQVVLTFDDGYRNNLHVAAPVLRSAGLPFAVFVCTRNVDSGKRYATYLLRAGIHLTEQDRLRVSSLGLDFDLRSAVGKRLAVMELSGRLKSAPQDVLESAERDLMGLHSPERWAELDEQFASDAPLNWDEIRSLSENGAKIGSHGRSHCILHDQQDEQRIRLEIHASRKDLISRVGACDYFSYPNGRAQDISARAVAETEAAGYRLGFSSIFGEICSNSPRTLLPRIDADEDLDTLKFYLHTAYTPRHSNDGQDRAVST